MRISIVRGSALQAALGFWLLAASSVGAQTPKFKVLGFSTSKDDAGHVSYEHEANRWFPKIAAQYGFKYDSTKVWTDCNAAKLSQYQVVIFFDERPEDKTQRAAIEQYIKGGGGFIATHGSAFELAGSQQPTNWSWYHDTLYGSGEYKSNTWRPTSAFLKREDSTTPYTAGMPALFKASPNEWYRWKNDLKTKKDIKILYSIDPSSFPLGTGPKPEEIWHDGYYPVVWTNVKYKMLYLNMGHNDLNSPENNGKDSETFANDIQNKLIINAMLSWTDQATAMAHRKPASRSPGPALHLKGSQVAVSKAGAAGSGAPEFDVHGRELAPAEPVPSP
jgi:hypothetical protein